MEIRNEIEKLLGERILVVGTFDRIGKKWGFQNTTEYTFLLINLRDEKGDFLCDHMWFNQTLGFKRLGKLRKGTKIQFKAKCEIYKKNGKYNDNGFFIYKTVDYHLSRPTQFEVIK